MSDESPGETTLTIVGPERPRLLIVDDEPVNVQTLYQVFQSRCEVIVATNGHKALELCLAQKPDLVLLDVVMPEIDGLEVCRRLKSNPATRDIPVLFVTAQDSPEEETQGLEVGAVDFISKPINPAVVRARVNTQLTLKAQTDFLRSLAFIDGLTGVANRRQYNERLATEWRACQRSGKPLGLIMIDVDFFKFYNDHYGHEAGDDCLRAVSRRLKELPMRSRDLLARYGGEEFVLLMPEADLDGTRRMAELIRGGIEDLAIPHSASTTAEVVTASLGAASLVPDEDLEARQLQAEADRLLYEAKRQGRNRVAG